jgi:polyketide cyclase/dehydrase/lipid transport protein
MTPHHFAKSIDIDATPEAVLGVMLEIERWPEWTPSVTRIDRLTPGPLVVGSRARIRQPRLPPALWTVSAVDPGRSFTWISKGPGILVTAFHVIEARGSGSRVTLSIRYEGLLATPVAWLTRNINERYLAMEANGLKARCEDPRRAAPAPSKAVPPAPLS